MFCAYGCPGALAGMLTLSTVLAGVFWDDLVDVVTRHQKLAESVACASYTDR